MTPQEVPEEFAALLRRLHHDDDPVLNPLLAASREHGWRTPTLAATLGLKPPAVSKRIERARRAERDALRELDPDSDPAVVRAWRALRAEQTQIARRLAKLAIPDAPLVHATIDGRQLPAPKIGELLALQKVAEKVNGAMRRDHPARRDSERLSAELHRLITEEGFTPYYLGRVLGRSHRAITSRLERHHFRAPCPSVAGTPSGEYRNRKIGDPVEAPA